MDVRRSARSAAALRGAGPFIRPLLTTGGAEPHTWIPITQPLARFDGRARSILVVDPSPANAYPPPIYDVVKFDIKTCYLPLGQRRAGGIECRDWDCLLECAERFGFISWWYTKTTYSPALRVCYSADALRR